MSFSSLLIHTVQILAQSEGAEDRYGNTEQVFTPGASYNARVQQVRSTSQGGREILASRDTRVTWYTVYLPANAPFDALDMLLWNGKRLQVDGEPAKVDDSSGSHHVELIAREVAGG